MSSGGMRIDKGRGAGDACGMVGALACESGLTSMSRTAMSCVQMTDLPEPTAYDSHETPCAAEQKRRETHSQAHEAGMWQLE